MGKLLNISKKTIVYVMCPANLKTGGTELLHQLVYTLNSIGRKAIISYYYEGKYNNNNPTPDEFKKYISKYTTADEIKDDNENIIVFPEVCIGKQKRYKRIQKCIWWLSVDNYKETKGKINRLKKYGVLSFLKHLYLNDYVNNDDLKAVQMHFYQSYFALDFIKSLGISEAKTAYLSDYINDMFTEEVHNDYIKRDVVIYNPKKGKEFTKKIIESNSEINYIPIINMTNAQVFELMHEAKVYIDFGNHPGKDRIPREAAVCGCCIITGRRGSAGNNKDVPIPEKYKFEDKESNISNIIQQIKRCIKNYDDTIDDFSNYKKKIMEEKLLFEKSVSEIFELTK